MKSSKPGRHTLAPEITNISQHGIWLYHADHEYFLSYKMHPWFKDATVAQIHNVKLEGKTVFHWQDLDVDLDIARIASPEKYPLDSRA